MSEGFARRLRQVVNGSRDAYAEADGEGRVTEWSTGAETLLGWTRAEMLGRPVASVFPPDDAASVQTAIETLKSTPFALSEAVEPDMFILELTLIARDGSIVTTKARLFVSGTRGSFRVCAFLLRGDADQDDRAEPLPFDTVFDERTRLASGQVFEHRLASALRDRDARTSIAVVAIVLDRFAVINDVFGVELGDLLLAEMADRLRAAAYRSNGRPLLARRSGAQFLAFFQRADGRAESVAQRFTERLVRSLAAPVVLDNQEVYLTASFGVCVTQRPDDEASALISNAATAAYESARVGGGRLQVYEPSMRSGQVERLTTESALHHALERGELACQYQPVVDMATSSEIGVEALVRWRHPALGEVEPSRFIPLAEENGLIIPIGAWVLEEACRQLTRWRTHGWSTVGFMDVNLSARQVDDPELVDLVRGALSEARLPASSLVCEITESTLMRDADTSLAVLRALKAVGVVLAVDDFGTGYSSLNYLRRFPVDMLKLDMCFVQSIEERESAKIVSAIVNLAHELGMVVVAEGVETAIQDQLLRRLGCDIAQGMWYAPPLDAAEVDRPQRLRREA